MMQKNIILAMLVMSVLFTSVENSSHAYCPAGAILKSTSTEVAAGDAEDFDYISYYQGPNKDSLPLLIFFGDASTPFTMKAMKTDGTYKPLQTCVGSENHEFVDIMQGHLILKSSDTPPVFKKCLYKFFDTASDLPMLTIVKHPDLTDYKSVKVLGMDPSVIFFAVVSDTDQHAIVRHNWDPWAAPDTRFFYTAPDSVGQSFDHTKLINHRFVYDGKGYFMNRVGWDWFVDSIITAADVADHHVDTFIMLQLRGIVALTHAATMNTGSIYTVNQQIATKVDAFTIATPGDNPIQFKYFSDHLYNFVRLSAGNLAWITLTTTSVLWSTSFPIQTANVFNVGLGRNKAMVMYSNGAMTVLEHNGDGSVRKVFENKGTSGTLALDEASVDAGNQFTISFSCLCKTINGFFCFPETLNCVILNQAKKVCEFIPDTQTSWPSAG